MTVRPWSLLVVAGLLSNVADVAAQAAGAPRAQALRGRIETAFIEQVGRQLALSPEQRAAVGRILSAHGERRRELETEERQLHRTLERHLRPGVAANADSVSRSVDRMLSNRVEYAESFRTEMNDLRPILSPVQQAQFLMLREQIFRRIRELQEGRPGPEARGRP